MKLVLGVNLFGNEKRHKLARESYVRLSEKFGIELVNLQFSGDNQVLDDRFILKELSYSAIDICGGDRQLPMTKDVFDILSKLGADIFIFTNDDIIIAPTFIEHILATEYDSYSASRMSIKNMDSLEDEIKLDDHYQVAGFDMFAINTSWWEKNRQHFHDYILGQPCWDVHYAMLCMRYGKGFLANKWPPPCYHISHPIAWTDHTIQRQYNERIFWEEHSSDARVWNIYLHNVLLKRPHNFTGIFENEPELEQIYFKL